MPSVFDHPAFSSTMFFPRRDATRTPPGATDVAVDVGDGVRLHLRAHEAPDARAALLLFHGNGEVVADYDGAAKHFARAGVALMVVDYRGYGASTGRPTLRAVLADASRVLDAALALRAARPLVVMGRSLGSLSAAVLCDTAREAVRGYVFESGIGDLDSLVARRGITLDAPLSDRDRDDFDPLRRHARCSTPALVLHGARDTLIAPHEAQATFDALATTDKTLVYVPDRGHNDLSLHDDYWRALTDFVRRVTVT